MTADPIRQRLDEIYNGRGENDPLTDYTLYDRALTEVLDRHVDDGYGYCAGCMRVGVAPLHRECPDRANVAAALGVSL